MTTYLSYRISIRPGGIKRVFSLSLTGAFLFTNVLTPYAAEKNFWSERQKTVQKMKQESELLGTLTSAGMQVPKQPVSHLNKEQYQLLAQLPHVAKFDLSAPTSSLSLSRTSSLTPTPLPLGQEAKHSRALVEGGQRPGEGDQHNKRNELNELRYSDSWLSAILPYGSIGDIYISKRSDSPLVIHIQDVHGVLEAQKNISNIITAIVDAQRNRSPKTDDRKPKTDGEFRTSDFGPRTSVVIGLEGAAGAFNIHPYRNFPDAEVTKDIAEYFLKEGYIGGPEFAALTAPETPFLWGVEDLSLYEKNIQTIYDSQKSKPQLQAILNELKKSATSLKEKIYSKELKEFDQHFNAYKNEQEKLGDYVRYLFSTLTPISTYPHPNLNLLLQALQLEETLDFKVVEQERIQLIETLVKKLTQEQLTELVQESINYKLGHLNYGEYHQYLKQLCKNNGIPIRNFAKLNSYINYVGLAERINRNKLLDELTNLEEQVQNSLAVTQEQKRLVAANKSLIMLQKLANHEMTTDDWKQYESLSSLRFLRFLSQKNQRLNEPNELNGLKELLMPFEDFCRYATQRNNALVSNLLTSTLTSTYVLIAGGFHTQGLTQILRQKDVSYITVTPKITEVPKDNHYLDVFARKPLPLEKLFTGEKIFIVSPLLTAEKVPHGLSLIDFKRKMNKLKGEFSSIQILTLLDKTAQNNGSEEELQKAIDTIEKSISQFGLQLKELTPNDIETITGATLVDSAQITGENYSLQFSGAVTGDNKIERDAIAKHNENRNNKYIGAIRVGNKWLLFYGVRLKLSRRITTSSLYNYVVSFKSLTLPTADQVSRVFFKVFSLGLIPEEGTAHALTLQFTYKFWKMVFKALLKVTTLGFISNDKVNKLVNSRAAELIIEILFAWWFPLEILMSLHPKKFSQAHPQRTAKQWTGARSIFIATVTAGLAGAIFLALPHLFLASPITLELAKNILLNDIFLPAVMANMVTHALYNIAAAIFGRAPLTMHEDPNRQKITFRKVAKAQTPSKELIQNISSEPDSKALRGTGHRYLNPQVALGLIFTGWISPVLIGAGLAAMVATILFHGRQDAATFHRQAATPIFTGENVSHDIGQLLKAPKQLLRLLLLLWRMSFHSSSDPLVTTESPAKNDITMPPTTAQRPASGSLRNVSPTKPAIPIKYIPRNVWASHFLRALFRNFLVPINLSIRFPQYLVNAHALHTYATFYIVGQEATKLHENSVHFGTNLAITRDGTNTSEVLASEAEAAKAAETIERYFAGETENVEVEVLEGLPVNLRIPKAHLQELSDAGWDQASIQSLLRIGLEQHLARGDGIITRQDLENLARDSDHIFFAIVDVSSHLWEDHALNRRIFINRALVELKQEATKNNDKVMSVIADAHFASGGAHEFIHEATGKATREFEEKLSVADREIIASLLISANVNLDVYEKVFFDVLDDVSLSGILRETVLQMLPDAVERFLLTSPAGQPRDENKLMLETLNEVKGINLSEKSKEELLEIVAGILSIVQQKTSTSKKQKQLISNEELIKKLGITPKDGKAAHDIIKSVELALGGQVVAEPLDVIGLFDPHSYRRGFDRIQPALERIVHVARTQGRPVVLIVEDDRNPLKSAVEGLSHPDKPTADKVRKFIMSGNKVFLKGLDEYEEKMQRNLKEQRDIMGGQPTNNILKYRQGLQDFINRYPEIMIFREQRSDAGWLAAAKAGVYNFDFVEAVAQGQQAAYIEAVQSAPQYLKHSWKLRDEAVRDAQLPYIKGHWPKAIVVIVRGSAHHQMLDGLAPQQYRRFVGTIHGVHPDDTEPVTWVAYRMLTYPNRPLSDAEKQYLKSEWTYAYEYGRNEKDPTVQDFATNTARLRPKMVAAIGQETLAHLRRETPPIFPGIHVVGSTLDTPQASNVPGAVGAWARLANWLAGRGWSPASIGWLIGGVEGLVIGVSGIASVFLTMWLMPQAPAEIVSAVLLFGFRGGLGLAHYYPGILQYNSESGRYESGAKRDSNAAGHAANIASWSLIVIPFVTIGLVSTGWISAVLIGAGLVAMVAATLFHGRQDAATFHPQAATSIVSGGNGVSSDIAKDADEGVLRDSERTTPYPEQTQVTKLLRHTRTIFLSLNNLLNYLSSIIDAIHTAIYKSSPLANNPILNPLPPTKFPKTRVASNTVAALVKSFTVFSRLLDVQSIIRSFISLPNVSYIVNSVDTNYPAEVAEKLLNNGSLLHEFTALYIESFEKAKEVTGSPFINDRRNLRQMLELLKQDKSVNLRGSGYIMGPDVDTETLNRWKREINNNQEFYLSIVKSKPWFPLVIKRSRSLAYEKKDFQHLASTIAEVHKTDFSSMKQLVNTAQTSLRDLETSFQWSLTYVEDTERYLLGGNSFLGIDLIEHILASEEAMLKARPGMSHPKLLEEYLLHETLEKTGLQHHEIIKITNKFFSRPSYGRPGETLLGQILREFIADEPKPPRTAPPFVFIEPLTNDEVEAYFGAYEAGDPEEIIKIAGRWKYKRGDLAQLKRYFANAHNLFLVIEGKRGAGKSALFASLRDRSIKVGAYSTLFLQGARVSDFLEALRSGMSIDYLRGNYEYLTEYFTNEDIEALRREFSEELVPGWYIKSLEDFLARYLEIRMKRFSYTNVVYLQDAPAEPQNVLKKAGISDKFQTITLEVQPDKDKVRRLVYKSVPPELDIESIKHWNLTSSEADKLFDVLYSMQHLQREEIEIENRYQRLSKIGKEEPFTNGIINLSEKIHKMMSELKEQAFIIGNRLSIESRDIDWLIETILQNKWQEYAKDLYFINTLQSGDRFALYLTYHIQQFVRKAEQEQQYWDEQDRPQTRYMEPSGTIPLLMRWKIGAKPVDEKELLEYGKREYKYRKEVAPRLEERINTLSILTLASIGYLLGFGPIISWFAANALTRLVFYSLHWLPGSYRAPPENRQAALKIASFNFFITSLPILFFSYLLPTIPILAFFFTALFTHPVAIFEHMRESAPQTQKMRDQIREEVLQRKRQEQQPPIPKAPEIIAPPAPIQKPLPTLTDNDIQGLPEGDIKEFLKQSQKQFLGKTAITVYVKREGQAMKGKVMPVKKIIEGIKTGEITLSPIGGEPWLIKAEKAGGHLPSETEGSPTPDDETSGPKNITSGTIGEKNHEEINKLLQRQFDTVRNLYNNKFPKDVKRDGLGIRNTLQSQDLITEMEADLALAYGGYLAPKEFRKLQDLRDNIRNSVYYDKARAIAGKDIEIFFIPPETNTELFWHENEYAAGHFSSVGARIHISLPLAIKDAHKLISGYPLSDRLLSVNVGTHELKHISHGQHDTSLDNTLEEIAKRDIERLKIARPQIIISADETEETVLEISKVVKVDERLESLTALHEKTKEGGWHSVVLNTDNLPADLANIFNETKIDVFGTKVSFFDILRISTDRIIFAPHLMRYRSTGEKMEHTMGELILESPYLLDSSIESDKRLLTIGTLKASDALKTGVRIDVNNIHEISLSMAKEMGQLIIHRLVEDGKISEVYLTDERLFERSILALIRAFFVAYGEYLAKTYPEDKNIQELIKFNFKERLIPETETIIKVNNRGLGIPEDYLEVPPEIIKHIASYKTPPATEPTSRLERVEKAPPESKITLTETQLREMLPKGGRELSKDEWNYLVSEVEKQKLSSIDEADAFIRTAYDKLKKKGGGAPGALGLWKKLPYFKTLTLTQIGWLEGWLTGIVWLATQGLLMSYGLASHAPPDNLVDVLQFTPNFILTIYPAFIAFTAVFLALSITLHKFSGAIQPHSKTLAYDLKSAFTATGTASYSLLAIPVIAFGALAFSLFPSLGLSIPGLFVIFAGIYYAGKIHAKKNAEKAKSQNLRISIPKMTEVTTIKTKEQNNDMAKLQYKQTRAILKQATYMGETAYRDRVKVVLKWLMLGGKAKQIGWDVMRRDVSITGLAPASNEITSQWKQIVSDKIESLHDVARSASDLKIINNIQTSEVMFAQALMKAREDADFRQLVALNVMENVKKAIEATVKDDKQFYYENILSKVALLRAANSSLSNELGMEEDDVDFLIQLSFFLKLYQGASTEKTRKALDDTFNRFYDEMLRKAVKFDAAKQLIAKEAETSESDFMVPDVTGLFDDSINDENKARMLALLNHLTNSLSENPDSDTRKVVLVSNHKGINDKELLNELVTRYPALETAKGILKEKAIIKTSETNRQLNKDGKISIGNLITLLQDQHYNIKNVEIFTLLKDNIDTTLAENIRKQIKGLIIIDLLTNATIRVQEDLKEIRFVKIQA